MTYLFHFRIKPVWLEHLNGDLEEYDMLHPDGLSHMRLFADRVNEQNERIMTRHDVFVPATHDELTNALTLYYTLGMMRREPIDAARQLSMNLLGLDKTSMQIVHLLRKTVYGCHQDPIYADDAKVIIRQVEAVRRKNGANDPTVEAFSGLSHDDRDDYMTFLDLDLTQDSGYLLDNRLATTLKRLIVASITSDPCDADGILHDIKPVFPTGTDPSIIRVLQKL